jgi:hypothetical protein
VKLARGPNPSSAYVDDATAHELACWLQEAGRRDVVAKRRAAPLETNLPLPKGPSDGPGTMETVRRPLMLAAVAVAGLQYFFVTVEVKILSLHSLIVFVSR